MAKRTDTPESQARSLADDFSDAVKRMFPVGDIPTNVVAAGVASLLVACLSRLSPTDRMGVLQETVDVVIAGLHEQHDRDLDDHRDRPMTLN